MADTPDAPHTLGLISTLWRQSGDLLAAHFALLKVEAGESAAKISAGLAKLAVAGAFALGGLLFSLAALVALLMRLGAPPDIACLAVGLGVFLVAWAIWRAAARDLLAENLVPRRTRRQIAAFLGRK